MTMIYFLPVLKIMLIY